MTANTVSKAKQELLKMCRERLLSMVNTPISTNEFDSFLNLLLFNKRGITVDNLRSSDCFRLIGFSGHQSCLDMLCRFNLSHHSVLWQLAVVIMKTMAVVILKTNEVLTMHSF